MCEYDWPATTGDRTNASSDLYILFSRKKSHAKANAGEWSGVDSVRWILISYDFMNNDTCWMYTQPFTQRTN